MKDKPYQYRILMALYHKEKTLRRSIAKCLLNGEQSEAAYFRMRLMETTKRKKTLSNLACTRNKFV